MTKREFMEMVIAETKNEELKVLAEEEIEKMDKANLKRSEKRAERKAENEPIKEKIFEVLNSEDVTLASEVAEKVKISTQKASALLRQMVEDGKVTVEDVKVKGKGTKKGYKVAEDKREKAKAFSFFQKRIVRIF